MQWYFIRIIVHMNLHFHSNRVHRVYSNTVVFQQKHKNKEWLLNYLCVIIQSDALLLSGNTFNNLHFFGLISIINVYRRLGGLGLACIMKKCTKVVK